MRKALLHGSALALVLIAAPFLAHARVGVTSTTTGEPLGTPPAQAQRVLKVGIDVFANERIQTKDNDRAHLLFADGSALTIGPNSDLVIDKFVYDPNTGSGDLAISATRGVFRLVGGKITKQGEGATMKVGTATLGLRGGIAVIDASNPRALDAFFMFGTKLTLVTPQGTQTATRPGSTLRLLFGQPPNAPALTPAGALTGPLAQLEAPTGQTVRGSAGVDGKVGQSGFSQVNSEGTGASGHTQNSSAPTFVPPEVEITLRPVSTSGGFVRDTAFISYDPVTGNADRDPANVTGIAEAGTYGGRLVAKTTAGTEFNLPWTPGLITPVNASNAISTLGPIEGAGYVAANEDFYIYTVLDLTSGKKINLFAGDLTPAASFPTTGTGAREILSLDVSRPFLGETASALPVVAGATQSPMLIAYSPVLSAAQQANSNERATWLQGSLNFQGTGATQSSFLSINIGQFGSDSNGAIYSTGTGQASLREDGAANVTRFSSNTTTPQTALGNAVYGATGDHFVFLPDQRSEQTPDTVTPQAGTQQDLATLTKSPYYYVTATGPQATPVGIGVNQSSGNYVGYTAGQIDQQTGANTIVSTQFTSGADFNNVSVSTSASNNRASARFQFSEVGNPSNTYDLKFGSKEDGNNNHSAFIDNTHYAIGNAPSTSFASGGNIVANVAMVTHQVVGNDPDLLPPSTAYCECEFMSWGYWMGDVQYTSGPRAGQSDRVHLATWVAGSLPNLNDIPEDGVAQYKGHAIGNVNNAGASYTAVGEFRQNWNFAQRQGAFQINNFDGRDYSGITSAPNKRDFSGNIATGLNTGPARTGTVNGSFFSSPTSPVAGQAGNFTINGANYSAAGTFAGSKQ